MNDMLATQWPVASCSEHLLHRITGIKAFSGCTAFVCDLSCTWELNTKRAVHPIIFHLKIDRIQKHTPHTENISQVIEWKYW